MPRNIIDLAEAYYRSPTEHEEMVDPAASLPPEIVNILDILSGDASPGGGSGNTLTEDTRRAVLFTLEKIIFSTGGNYYRVLGLSPDASTDQIRKHYDQLQRILFREDNLENWNNDYALRINQAYRTLRDPEKRHAYDESLQRHPDTTPGSVPGKTRKPGHDKHDGGSFIANSVHRAYSNHVSQPTVSADINLRSVDEKSQDISETDFPAGIPKHSEDDQSSRPSPAIFINRLGLGLLAGVIVIASLYFILLPPAIRDIPTASLTDIPATATPESPATDIGRVIRSPPPDDAPTPPQELPVTGESTSAVTAEVEFVDELTADVDTADTTTRPAEPAPARQATTPPPIPDPDPAPAAPESVPESAPAPTPMPVSPTTAGPALPPAPVIDISPARRVITTEELITLSSTFTRAYQSGDLDLMLGLFSEDARTNERSGKAEILRDYQELFDATESREFIIRDMRWQQGSDGGVSGEGNFEVNIRFRDDGSVNSLTGNIVLHIEKRPQGARITQLLHSYH